MIKQKNILIIGCGWLGHALAKKLSINSNVIVTTSSEAKKASFMDERFSVKLVVRTFEKTSFSNIDVAIVCLPPGRKMGSDSAFDRSLHENVLNALINSGCKKIVYTSSVSAYGLGGLDLIENQADSDSASCLLEAIYTQNADSTILRLGGLMGPERHPGKFLANKANVASPNGGVNFIHRNDAIRAIEFVLEQNLWGKCYNVVMPEHPTRLAFYKKAAEALGLIPPTFDMKDERHGKTVSSKKLVDSGYVFEFSNPMEALDYC